ncbi:MAG: hypothetical protein P0S96_01530 [Simkaniaceae bacterium]|nr:hypothetical protein [Candidatus Sacchlamyda saccharinae]
MSSSNWSFGGVSAAFAAAASMIPYGNSVSTKIGIKKELDGIAETMVPYGDVPFQLAVLDNADLIQKIDELAEAIHERDSHEITEDDKEYLEIVVRVAAQIEKLKNAVAASSDELSPLGARTQAQVRAAVEAARQAKDIEGALSVLV